MKAKQLNMNKFKGAKVLSASVYGDEEDNPAGWDVVLQNEKGTYRFSIDEGEPKIEKISKRRYTMKKVQDLPETINSHIGCGGSVDNLVCDKCGKEFKNLHEVSIQTRPGTRKNI